MASLLTLDKSGSVESSEVPYGLQYLVKKIKITKGWEAEFANEDVEQAELWLRTELSDSFT